MALSVYTLLDRYECKGWMGYTLSEMGSVFEE